MNTLSIVASFGALVWIFQDGNLSAPLAFQPLGFVETNHEVVVEHDEANLDQDVSADWSRATP